MDDIDISSPDRLKLQMEYALPIIKDLGDIIGEDVVLDALRKRLAQRVEAARAAGKGPRSPNAEAISAGFADVGANTLEYEIITSDADTVAVDVHECGYARLARELGCEQYASLLVCGEDYVSTAYAGTDMSRTQTKMLGGEFCNFRFTPGGSRRES